MQKSSYVHFLLGNFDTTSKTLEGQRILRVLLHNAFLTRTNMLQEIVVKCLLFLAGGKPKGEVSCLIHQNKKAAERNIFIFVSNAERVARVTLSH